MKLPKRAVFALSLREIAFPLACFFFEAVLAAILARFTTILNHFSVPDVTLSLIGTAISVLLAFRINAAYARWWEGRVLWGGITNSSRSLLRQAMSFARSGSLTRDHFFAEAIGVRLMGFANALRLQVTGGDAKLNPYVRSSVTRLPKNIPNTAATLIVALGQVIADALHAQILSEFAVHRMDTTLTELANAQGGIERISSTPMPLAFDLFPLMFVYLYSALLPLALADELGLFLPLVTSVIVFAFLVVTQIATNLESPFAPTPYAVASDQIVHSLEKFIQTELDALSRD